LKRQQKDKQQSDPVRSPGNGVAQADDTGDDGMPPDPEVTATARRRSFSAKYKLSIVKRADACSEPGQIGALLRREGLYSSHLSDWRKARDEGRLNPASPTRRGRKAKSKEAKAVAALRRDNERLRKKLENARRLLEIQKNQAQRAALTSCE